MSITSCEPRLGDGEPNDSRDYVKSRQLIQKRLTSCETEMPMRTHLIAGFTLNRASSPAPATKVAWHEFTQMIRGNFVHIARAAEDH